MDLRGRCKQEILEGRATGVVPGSAHQGARAPGDFGVDRMDSVAVMGDEPAEPFIHLGRAPMLAMGAELFNFGLDHKEGHCRKIKRLRVTTDPISKTGLPATRSWREVSEQAGVDQPTAHG